MPEARKRAKIDPFSLQSLYTFYKILLYPFPSFLVYVKTFHVESG